MKCKWNLTPLSWLATFPDIPKLVLKHSQLVYVEFQKEWRDLHFSCDNIPRSFIFVLFCSSTNFITIAYLNCPGPDYQFVEIKGWNRTQSPCDSLLWPEFGLGIRSSEEYLNDMCWNLENRQLNVEQPKIFNFRILMYSGLGSEFDLTVQVEISEKK